MFRGAEGKNPGLVPAGQVRVVGMIGVQREDPSTAGASLSVFGGSINPGGEIPAGVDGGYIAEFARAHEDAGFDMVLTGYSSSTPDGFEVAGYASGVTERLGYLIAHRPGFVAPTLAARKAATLDQLTGGRVALHIISGGSDTEQRQDGDWLDHDGRYRRTAEYLDVMKRVWTETEPFDFEGDFYRVRGARSQVRCRQQPHVPLFFGGASEAAVEVGARWADVFAFLGEPVESIRERVADLRQRAAEHGRKLSFSVSLRPVLADTLPRKRRGTGRGRSWRGWRSRPGGRLCRGRRHGRSRRCPSGWSTSQRLGKCMTSGCGCRLPTPAAERETRPAWWGRPGRWRTRCWPTTTSAAPASSCGDLIP